MAYNRFTISVISRVAALTLTIFLSAYFIIEFNDRNIFFIILVLLSVTAAQVFLLINFISRTNRELTRFLMMLKNSDYTVKFSDRKLERSFRDLAQIMDRTVESLRDLRMEKQIHVHLLKMITAEIRTGIITINAENEIILMNMKACNLLGCTAIQTWGQLRAICPTFAREAESIGTEGNKFTEIISGKQAIKVSLNVAMIPLGREKMKVITLEDIQSQVEVKESDAWLKLMRILMHEMMNSITPLTSLTETLAQILGEKALKNRHPELSRDDIEDIRFCLENIRKRKEHLLAFVENYHRLSRLPLPEKTRFRAFDIVNDVVCCMQAELEKEMITTEIDGMLIRMELYADTSQIEQALINIMKNGIQAMKNSARRHIRIKGSENTRHSVIEISDTGEGIPAEKIGDIFVPFYTTREGGSGIGLGLARQIMLAHHGFIRVQSEPGIGSTFSLWFEKDHQEN